MTLVIRLILLSFVLISFEVIIPGGILRFLEAIAIIRAGVLAFMRGATGNFIGNLVMVVTMLSIELKYLPKTKVEARMFLKDSMKRGVQVTWAQKRSQIKKGERLTKLAPTAKIVVEGKHYQAFSKDGLIKAGESLKIINRNNFRIVVKKFNKKALWTY